MLSLLAEFVSPGSSVFVYGPLFPRFLVACFSLFCTALNYRSLFFSLILEGVNF